MKIGLAIEKRDLQSEINQTFARAPFFVIYNSEDREVLFYDNEAKSASGGAGIKAAQFFVDKKVDAIIAFRLGENAVKVLINGKIKLFAARDNLSAESNIKLLLKNELVTLVEIHSGYHHG